jgi:hypothetical protein
MSNIELTTTLPNNAGILTWSDPKELSPRKERQLQTEIMPLRRLLAAVEDPNYPITKQEASDLLAANEIAVVVFLQSWTLNAPLPANADQVLDVETATGVKGLYNILIQKAAELMVAKQSEDNGFTVDSVENPKAPTGA